MEEKILKVGAEARLKVQGKRLIKERIKKGYRLPEIDLPLRKFRTQREANLMEKVRRIKVLTPKIYRVDNKTMEIEMDFVNGKLLDRVLNEKLAKQIGEAIAKLHSADIIHGDLTTSNIIVKNNDIYFIDFGLGEISHSVEKKGVDLKVLEEAIRATHPANAEKYIKTILDTYRKNAVNSEEVLKRLENIEKRGRYKTK